MGSESKDSSPSKPQKQPPKCGRQLPLDPSDPRPQCQLPRGHKGPHKIECFTITNEELAALTLKAIKRHWDRGKEMFGDDWDTWEETLDWFGIDENGYPRCK